VEIRAKCGFAGAKEALLEEDVSSPPFSPIDHKAGRVSGPVVKFSFHHPFRRRCFKIWFDRSKGSIDLVLLTSFEQKKQPVRGRKFIIIDKRHIIAGGAFNR